ncbi:hypothetical protein NEUTE2DRAFT_65012 [Neurospora tetrasperma FGSC 2509]|nr:hypothetical protein NEUTE2DRAFT_65012 [Neurospora tetrasperma FGSC 2509]
MPDSSPARRLSFPVWSKIHVGTIAAHKKRASGENQPPVTRSTVLLKQGRRPAVNQVRASTYLEICTPNSLQDAWRLSLTSTAKLNSSKIQYRPPTAVLRQYDFHMPLSTAVSRSLSLDLRRIGAAAFPFQAIRGDGTFGVAMPGISKPILKSSNRKMTGIMTRVQVENIH